MLDLLTSGLSVVFAPKMFILIIFAVFLGTLFGALPGVSATMAVTLGIPFTYKMDAVSAIAFLVAIYCASITGGGMTAILFKIPGVPSSAPTTYDGYPMAQRGEAGQSSGRTAHRLGHRRHVRSRVYADLQPSADPGCPELWPLGTVCHLLHGPVHPDKPGRKQCLPHHHLRPAGSTAGLYRPGPPAGRAPLDFRHPFPHLRH